jgi:hypothetical protein
MPGAENHRLYHPGAAVAAYLVWERGAPDDADRFLAIALAGEPSWITYDALGTIELYRGHAAEALAAYERALAIARDLGSDYLDAVTLSQIAFATLFAGRDDAVEIAATAEPIARATGNPTARMQAAWGLGVALLDKTPGRALELLEVAIELSRQVDNRLAYGSAATPAEELRTKLGGRPPSSDIVAALEQVEYWMTMGFEPNVWLTMRRIAREFAGLGDHEAAALAFGAEAEASSKLPMRAREGDRHQAAIDASRAALGGDDYDRLAARGAAMAPEDLVVELRRRAQDAEQAGDRGDRRPAS